MKNPRTPAEWQEVVNLAEWFLQLDSARQYGLVTGGPAIDVARCVDLLARGAARGVRPQADQVEALTETIVRELARGDR